VLHEFLEATDVLQRRASGDYSPDRHLLTLPEYRRPKPVVRGAGKTCSELFEDYVKAAKPAQSTVNRWPYVASHVQADCCPPHDRARVRCDYRAYPINSWTRVRTTDR
jgi:hypothetical protein